MRLKVSLLGVRFEIMSSEAALLDYTLVFMGAYEEERSPLLQGPTLSILISRGSGPVVKTGQKRQVHKSKHAYWNFEAEVDSDESTLRAHWPRRQLGIEIDWECRSATLEVEPTAGTAFAGEAIFHLLRSLAIYCRDGAVGNFLHASGVVGTRGAIIFLGNSNAGKTTLMMEAVIRFGMRPLTNDRILLDRENVPRAHSWPSYAS